MATGDDGDARRKIAYAPTTPGADETHAPADTETSPGRVIAPPTIAGDESMLHEGDAVDRYRIEAYLGRGGMGVVYRARDPDLDRALAIKLVRSRHRGGDRMLREAQAMARLDHTNVVPIFDVGMRGEQLFIVMPFLSGGTLGDWCRACARPWHEVVRRYLEAGRGLEAAHLAGLVHRDFKPDNVLIDSQGEVHVADFGLARAQLEGDQADRIVGSGPLGYALTQAGELLGTPAYMAPEQLDGDPVDARADQFSFCVALYEGLYGKRPFDVPKGAGIVELREAMREERVRAAPADRQVPKPIREALLRGLRHSPAARWPSLSELLDELEHEVARRAPARPRRPTRAPRRRGPAIAAAAAAVAVVAGVATFIATRGSSDARRAPRTPSAGPASGGAGEASLDTPFTSRPLTFRGDIDLYRLSQDGMVLAFLAGGDLHVMATSTGEVRTIARNLIDGRRPRSLSWSVDGRHVLLVHLVDAERSTVDLVNVTSGAVEHRELAVWPFATLTGPREIASVMNNGRDVRFTAIDGDLPTRRCHIPGDYTWMNDVAFAGGAIFVTVVHEDQTLSVLRTDRHCLEPAPVLERVAAEYAVVDPDGSHVGVARRIGGVVRFERTPVAGGAPVERSRPLRGDILRVAGIAAGGQLLALDRKSNWRLLRIAGDPAQVTKTLGAGTFEQRHALSPDHKRAAVIDERDSARSQLRIVAIDQLDARPWPLPLLEGAKHASWSPDGTRLAVLRERDGGGLEISIAPIAPVKGGTARVKVSDAGELEAPVWLDDQRIAYQRSDHRTYVEMDLGTFQKRALLPPDLGSVSSLTVNPRDGSLALDWDRGRGGRGIYVVRASADPVKILALDSHPVVPTWSPDGRTLWLHDTDGGIAQIDVATRTRTPFFVFETNDGTQLAGVTPIDATTALVELARPTSDVVVLE